MPGSVSFWRCKGHLRGRDFRRISAFAVRSIVSIVVARQQGVDLRERGISHYNSVTDVFRAVLDMPADLHIGSVALSARKR